MASPGKPSGISTYKSYPRNLTNVNGTLYFTADDSINGQELWKVDSTKNAVLVKDINPGPKSSYVSNLTNVDGTTYFTASDAINGQELWKTDSTGITALVKDINLGAENSFPGEFTNVNGTFYFTAFNGTRRELRRIGSNGNAALVKYINSNLESSDPSNLTNVDGILYFTKGQQLWKVDNTADAILVKDLNSRANPSFQSSLTNVDGMLYFTATDFANEQQLLKINNSGDVTVVKNFNYGTSSSSYLSSLTNVDGNLYFVTNKLITISVDNNNEIINNGQELWRIGSNGNAVLIKDINPGSGSSYLSNLTNVNGTLYFTANDTTSGQELWRIGSNDNAVLVKDINPGTGSSYLSSLTNVNGTLYFTANGRELWRIDSTDNAVLIKDLNPGGSSYGPSTLTNVNVNGTLYFTANDTTSGQELWRIGSNGNAELVKDINPGDGPSTPLGLTNVDGALYFTAYNATTGRELWKIDDTGNAVLVNDINPGGNARDPYFDTFAVDPGGRVLDDEKVVANLFNRNLLETTSSIKGVSIQAVSQNQTNKVNEIGFFNVDDRDGKIGGIAPNQAGYLKAAIERSKSILTTLGGNFFNTQKQEIGLDPNKIYQFFEVENGSLTEVKQKLDKGETPTNIRLSNLDTNGNSPIKITGNSIQSGYNVSINNDELVLKVTKLDGIVPNRPIGSDNQGKIEGRTIDLTKYKDRFLTVDIKTTSDAAYQSQIGFYVVKDALGTIELADGTTVKPGDANYAMVAVKNAIANAVLQANRIDRKTNQPIAGGQIYAPVVVAQGTLNDFVNKTSNNIQAYFNYVGANTDKVDHFRQIGANTFGVEDMYGGGDRDFNDIVIQMNIKTV